MQSAFLTMSGSFAVRTALAVVLGLAGTWAQAGGAGGEGPVPWSFSGFGTLGAAYHDEPDTRFRRSVDQRGGARAGHLEVRNDSLLGVQVNAALDPRWSMMAQAVARQGVDRRWTPQLTWGFIKYAPSDAAEFRLGRMAVDIYLDGDSRHVGYIYTTVRPYADVYGRLTLDTFDGADASFQRMLGPGQLRFKVFGGRTRGDIYLNQSVYALERGRSFGATLDWVGPQLSLKLSWGSMMTTRDRQTDPLREGLLSFAPLLPDREQAFARAAEIASSNRVSYLGVGVGWEQGPFSLQIVGTDMSMTIYPGFAGWGMGATVACRIGDWKPYATYSRSIIDAQKRDLDLPAGHPFAPYWLLANEYTLHDQHTAGIGVRYDLSANAALKLQLDRVDAKRSSSLLDDAGNRTGARRFMLFSASLDFVF